MRRVPGGRCSGEGEDAKAAASEVDAFIVFRDSEANPFANWQQGVVAVEIERIAESDDARFEAYRECFRQLGIPADVARNPTAAFSEALNSQNRASEKAPVTEDMVRHWREGKDVLDSDGGTLARGFARCWRTFEEHLTPVLETKRNALVDEKREVVMEGQSLLYDAVGGEESITRESTNW